MSVVITIGAAGANSYATVAEADAYNLAHPYGQPWTTASSATKEAALLMGARLLDESFVWTGAAVDETQALCWPRTGMYTRNGFSIASTVIPTALKYAQSEFARQLIVADRSEDNEVLKQSISSLRAGPVSLTFKLPGEGSNSVQMRNADVIAAGPDFAWLSKVVPDAVRSILVASWYTRRLVGQPPMFGVVGR